MHKPKLTLTPVDHGDWGEIVVETDTMLGRSSQPFASKEAPELAELSRQHARIFLKDGAFYLVDLGSRNGTTLNGEEVSDIPALIADGDEIGLAKKLHFHAWLNGNSDIGEKRLTPSKPGPMEDATEDTILFSASDRFLEGFYEQEEATRVIGPVILTDRQTSPKGRVRLALAFGAVILGLMGLLYFKATTSDPKGKIEALLLRNQFDEAFKVSTTHLRAHPDDAALAGLWLDSFANQIVSNWSSRIDKKQFDEAGEMLKEARISHSPRPEANEFLDLLAWATQLESFLHDREKQPKINLYQDEYEIHRLLDGWNHNKLRYRSAMEDLSRRSALFRSKVDSLWNSLSIFLNRYALQLDAIDRLKAAIGAKLEARQGQALLHELDDFEAMHPQVMGVDRLKNDLALYLAIERSIGRRELAEAARLRRSYPLQMPPFVERASRLFQDADAP